MDASYTAGLIDGEGTITINNSKQADTYAIRVAVGMCDVATAIITGLQRTYGGRVNPMKPDSERSRPQLRWTVEGETAAAVLEIIRPFLILKAPQADLALTLQKQIRRWRDESGRHFWNHPRRHEAEVLKRRLNDMNLRGIRPSPPLLPPGTPVAVFRWGTWWEPNEDLFGPVQFKGKLPASGRMIAGHVYAHTERTSAAPLPGLLPTPAAGNFNDGESAESWQARNERLRALGINGNGMGTPLTVAVQLLKTPTAQLAVNGGSQHPEKRKAGGHGPTLADQVEHQLLPTPSAALSTGGQTSRSGDRIGEPLLPSIAKSITGGGRASADTRGAGLEVRAVESDRDERQAAERSGGDAPADTDGSGRGLDGERGRQGRESQQFGLRAAEREPGNIAWGAYEPAIRRWESVLGRPAPRPTEPGRTGERLSPAFVEWLMGLPDGWVTDVPGLSRNAQLKALGNGVVPQQAAMALRMLLGRTGMREAA